MKYPLLQRKLSVSGTDTRTGILAGGHLAPPYFADIWRALFAVSGFSFKVHPGGCAARCHIRCRISWNHKRRETA